MTHGHFESTFSKYAFGRGGGGHKKEYAVYARENDDNYGRPLTDYVLKADTAATSLKSAGEEIRDSLLVAMVLKGLPTQCNTFKTVATQREREMS